MRLIITAPTDCTVNARNGLVGNVQNIKTVTEERNEWDGQSLSGFFSMLYVLCVPQTRSSRGYKATSQWGRQYRNFLCKYFPCISRDFRSYSVDLECKHTASLHSYTNIVEHFIIDQDPLSESHFCIHSTSFAIVISTSLPSYFYYHSYHYHHYIKTHSNVGRPVSYMMQLNKICFIFFAECWRHTFNGNAFMHP